MTAPTPNDQQHTMLQASQDKPVNRPARREIRAELIETTPASQGIAYWLLAAPLIVFAGWLWVDLFAHYSPIPWYWLDTTAGVLIYLVAIILPFGVAAHRVVTSLPRLFQHAGWDVRPLEPILPEEQYTVRYVFQARRRAANTWGRWWLRAAQGWVYLEIGVILAGGVLMIPLFFSAAEFGFGK